MPDSLTDLLDNRGHLLQELSEIGDFQPGSITNVTWRCAKPNEYLDLAGAEVEKIEKFLGR